MSSRGRGYSSYNSRGGYSSRGNGYRGSYRGSTRGSYESRGRGGYYNSDTRYHSSSTARYTSSRDRMEEPYKKSYRSENSTGYSNREYEGRSGSPERKRMRIEGSSSDRRSHDGGGHYGSSYGGRQDSYSGERRSYATEDRRRSPAPREYRKPMGPPRASLRSRGPRGRPFRGRTMRTRSSYRGAPRLRGTFAPRRYADRSLSYTRAFNTIKARSPAKSKDEASSTEEDWDADEKDAAVDSKEFVLKSPKAEAEAGASDGEGGDAGGDTDKEPDAASDVPPPPRPRNYVHLACVHCKEKHATFAAYVKHLGGHRHREAMSAVARRHKTQLLRMRVAQRGAQREIEEGADAGELALRTTFCLICRLNHRTTRHAHNQTDTHRAMKRFLMPFCRTCRMSFRSPMIYEHHICSVEHLKRKSQLAVRRASPKAEASGDEGMDVDLENFMTLDSVGDVDEVEDEDSGTEKKDDASPKKPKVEINVGSEHIKKLEVFWCDLCRVYLPRGEAGATGAGAVDPGEALRRHCRLRIHLARYVQHRDTRTLRKQAERIHRQLHQQKEEKAAEEAGDKLKVEKTEPVEEKKLENGTDAANAAETAIAGSEDKLWADVDKDLGELLSEVDPQGPEGSDDEDELSRYDKFRKSDKKPKVAATEEAEGTPAEATADQNNGEVEAAA